jgi:TRAP transporter TAXI family solute receptor
MLRWNATIGKAGRGAAAAIVSAALFFFLFSLSPALAQRSQKIHLGTGSLSGTYYSYGSILAKTLTATTPGISLTALGTLGSTDNIRLLKKKEIELAMVQNNIADFAFRGVEGFDGPCGNLRAVAALYPEFVQIVVRGEGPVRSFSQLRGLKVGVGTTGSRMTAIFSQLIDAYGLKETDIHIERHSFSLNAWHFKEGNLDAFVIVSAIPSPIIADAGSSMNVRILPIESDKIAKVLRQHAFLEAGTIPAHTYKGQDGQISTLVVRALLVTTAELSEDTVYRITRSLFEHNRTIAEAHPAGKNLNPHTATRGVSIPFHPGALRYFREKGVLK